jgi:hypothetical protein
MSLENAIHDVIHRVGVSFVRKKIMYKFIYKENGIPNTIISIEKRPLELLMRHLLHLHCAYKAETSEFEVLYFGKNADHGKGGKFCSHGETVDTEDLKSFA